MAASKAVYEAFYKKYGAIMVDCTDELYSAMYLLSAWAGHMPTGTNYSSFSSSGGENVNCTDMCEKHNISLPAFAPETVEKLKALLPPYAPVRNPLDMTGGVFSGFTDDFQVNIMSAIGDDPNINAIIYKMHPFNVASVKDKGFEKIYGMSMNERYGNGLLHYAETKDAVPIVVIPNVEDARDFTWCEKLAENHIPVIGNSDLGFDTLRRVNRYIEERKIERSKEHCFPQKKHSGAGTALTELASKNALADYGLPIPIHRLVERKEELAAALSGMDYPIAMKISSPDIMHKTDAGGVALHIRDEKEAFAAFDSVMESCKRYRADAVLEGVIVTPMSPSGKEMILGVSNNPVLGPMLMVGMGGVFVEVFEDVALYPCPLGKQEALEMLSSLKAFRLLAGHRGEPPCDIDALTDLMVQLSEYAASQSDVVKELDLNPVFVYPQGEGVRVIDALIVRYDD
jgi:acetyltransferase